MPTRARKTADSRLRAPTRGVEAALVAVTPRASDSPTRSAPEVLGAVSPADLRALITADPARAGDAVATHAGPAPAAGGAGENAAEAFARVDGPVRVLVDGRVVALEHLPGNAG